MSPSSKKSHHQLENDKDHNTTPVKKQKLQNKEKLKANAKIGVPVPMTVNQVEKNLAANVLSENFRKEKRGSYTDSLPYLHGVIHPLFDDDLLRKVRFEIMNNLRFTEKETDIYKVHQTGDLANIDGLPLEEKEQLGSLFALRNTLYSAEFRRLVSGIAACGHLSGSKMDMSVNTYVEGCHLLCHDDVIGSRRVSFILYLPDPDQEWLPEYGGALELYPVLEKGIPATDPTVIIPPKWNQFAFFTVLPGHSFHAVQEVVATGKPRLSISGWFHIPQPGETGYDPLHVEEGESSLTQLVTENDDNCPFSPYQTITKVDEIKGFDEFDKNEIQLLFKFISPAYLDIRTLMQIPTKFEEDDLTIQLTKFLKSSVANKILELTEKADKKDGMAEAVNPPHRAGVRDGWDVEGSPHKNRWLALNPKSTPQKDSLESILIEIHAFFASDLFKRYLQFILRMPLLSYRGRIRRFRSGLDYSLATTNSKSILDSTLCLTDKQEIWETDELGGYDCYMEPDEQEDAAVYRANESGGALLSVSAAFNVLNLVVREESVMRFIKYVSARAPGSRWDVAFEYELADEEGSDKEDQE